MSSPASFENPGSPWSLLSTLGRPQVVAWTGIAALVAIGWAYLAIMVADMVGQVDMAEAGPGMSVFNMFSAHDGLGALGMDLLRSICRVDAGFDVFSAEGVDVVRIGFVFAMWAAMAFAMMTPSAAPMFTTYAEIAQTAREKQIDVVSPAVVIAGYMSVWLLFCLGATVLQILLAQASLLSPGLVATSPYIGAGVLLAAGAYQFTSLKAACLSKCRTPFPFFFANWSDRFSGVFKMGVQQGLTCVGCCWALMLVMFAAGLMNVIWIAVLAVIMLLEKVLPRPQLVVRGSGVVFIIWAVGLIALQNSP